MLVMIAFATDAGCCVCAAGPRLFLSCPMSAAESHSWFTDLWNYSIVPYLLEAVRDGVQVGIFGPRYYLWNRPHICYLLQEYR